MDETSQIFITIISTALASSGMWAFIMKKTDKRSAQNEMLIGLGHDRIVSLCMFYINRCYITQDEYENLYEYLYKPYKKLGGNGSAERLMQEVNKLEIRSSNYTTLKENK